MLARSLALSLCACGGDSGSAAPAASDDAPAADTSSAAPELETVTLDCGREAIRFSGIQPFDDYGTPIDATILGYGMLLDGIPVIVCYAVFNEAAVEADRLTELAHYVEEMANTVRIAA